MALALKSHTPISTRSPYFINCVPAAGTIVSAELTLTVQLGDRRSSVTSMTDIKEYVVNKTDAIDGVIVFDIAPLVKDFYKHEYLEFATSDIKTSNDRQVFFLKVVKSIVNSTGTEADVTTYYMLKDGYASFKDGVNYLPSTGATGNYPFEGSYGVTTAYGTDVTIMATDCYRQIGENSYALLAINTGEFDRLNSDSASFTRVKFGPGEDWKTDVTQTTNVVDESIAAVSSSSDRYGEVKDALLYTPLGKVNMLGDWVTGFDYLRVGHFVTAPQILPKIIEVEPIAEVGYLSYNGGTGELTITTDFQPITQSVVTFEMPAFVDCTVSWPNRTDTWVVTSIGTMTITIQRPDTGAGDQAECLAATALELNNFGILTYQRDVMSNEMLSINDQPILRYEILCEPKYNVIDCVFINKWGCWDSFSFLKKSVEKFNVSSSEYNRSVGEIVSNVYTYNTQNAQKIQFNKNGFKAITVNTGFVNESFNLLLEEMMLSEKMFLVIDDVFEPVVLNTSSIEFKKNVNDGLINYTLDFDFAYNTLQASI